MTRRDRRRSRVSARGKRQVSTPQSTAQRRLSINFGDVDRKALLLGTALVSTLLFGTMTAPTPAHAVVDCLTAAPPSPGPIDENNPGDSIICVNTEPRTNAAGDAIFLGTDGDDEFIRLDNSGLITASDTNVDGIDAETDGDRSPITITNSAKVNVNAEEDAEGIEASTGGVSGDSSHITVTNSGDLNVTGGDDADGIDTETDGPNSSTTIWNSGYLNVVSGDYSAAGIESDSDGDTSPITVTNSGDMHVVSLDNVAHGIEINTDNASSPVEVTNSGDLTVVAEGDSDGIDAETYGDYSPVTFTNTGDIKSTSLTAEAEGLDAYSDGFRSPVSVINRGNIEVDGVTANGIDADSDGNRSPVSVTNSGDITVNAKNRGLGIFAVTGIGGGDNSPITINNSGDIEVNSTDENAAGISAYAFGLNSPIKIINSGSLYAKGGGLDTGIAAYSYYNNRTTIINTGDISSRSHSAIYVNGAGTANIYNAGKITGYVDLTEQSDLFVNQAGGVFETKMTSLFGGGNDLFINQSGGTVQAATDGTVSEASAFEGLETFRNQGLISLVDNKPGDSFTISNTPGGTDLDFVASGGSTLAVDAFLGGPGSRADTLTIEGDVSGVTTVQVVNTNYGPGVFNPSGILVVTATGATPNPDAFQLDQPIDTGFFNYDLFFTPTGSGFWELRSFAGPGAFLLPQLVTAAQDIWHQSASTWFDRTADLRVLMTGGPAPTAYDPGGKSLGGAAPYSLTPAVWARGSGSWLNRDDTERTTAYGRNYSFDLDRELQTIDFQVGVDMGKRDALTQGDALVFGLLGGFVHGDLDYDALARNFNFDGGQVGAYATYLNGGLFVDTLLNVHLYSLETSTLGFPDSLDANTVGLRTDTGYRFGSFSGGPFIEPLATLEVTWADVDGFSLGGNTVSFDDDANVRGRLGLRAGTTMNAWEGTLMEPFVTGSLWGNLTDDNQATLVSTGRTFRFEDQLEDVWGEFSAGVNFFNFSQTTAVFAKVDVTFGDDVSGVGGKAGMRVNW